MKANEPVTLRQELGVASAVMLGLGSIVGTGVFVSIGIAAGVAGASVVLAIPLAALVATCNALSSAQLAASHPVSGGTYEYGYHFLRPWLGFSAGWMFLCAKCASAATAALGFSGYLLHGLGADASALVPVAVATTLILTVIVLRGIRQANWTNILIVSVTWLALGLFILFGVSHLVRTGDEHLMPFWPSETGWPGFLEASALMFVAFTGYGRIATLSEEVRDPRHTIPRAIIVTLVLSALLYVAVGIVAVGAAGADALAEATLAEAAPLEIVAERFGVPGIPSAVAVGAMTAMLGVLLNLILGLSRVLLAMGRRGDMPAATAKLNASATTPYVAVIVIGILVTTLAAIGNVKTTWSFSAFTVLTYYAITNLAALALPPGERLFSRVYAWAGLGSCLFLAFWVERSVWLTGLLVLGIGLLWHLVSGRLRSHAAVSLDPD
ncbi:MAG TPA: APC family permease [Vicinamibacteria bacterium]